MTMLPFGQVAPIQRRAIAYIIDALIGGAVTVVIPTIVLAVLATVSGDLLMALIVAGPLFSILGIAWLVVYTLMQAGRGSIGMRAQGIRLAALSDGSPIGFGRALLRNVIWGLAASIVVGYFSALFDGSGRHQGWHDKVAGAVMLDGRVPAHRPAFRSTAQPSAPGHDRLLPAEPSGTAMPGFSTPPSMPGFAAPAPTTAMPGLTPPAGDSAPTDAASAPTPSPAAAAPMGGTADEAEVEHTVISPRISRDLPDDPLISFVPGVTQEPPKRQDAPAASDTDAADQAAETAAVDPFASAPAAAFHPPAAPQPAAPQPAEPAVSPAESAPSEPSAIGSASAAPAEPALAQDSFDDMDDIESTRISVPGHRLVFTWDDGQRATVSGRTVFGRNPEDGGGATNVPVRDETRSLSKTHFEAGADAKGGWVMDRQSTNGTVIVRDGVRIACPPGQRVPIRLGDALEIGDRIVTIGGYA